MEMALLRSSYKFLNEVDRMVTVMDGYLPNKQKE